MMTREELINEKHVLVSKLSNREIDNVNEYISQIVTEMEEDCGC